MFGINMKRLHAIEFDDSKMVYSVHRVVDGQRIIVAEIDIRSLFSESYDKSFESVALAIGEAVFADSKSGVEAAWQFAQDSGN